MNEEMQTMEYYMDQIPEMIRRNTKDSEKLTESLVNAYIKEKAKRIMIVASGSSYNAAMCARPYMQRILKKEVSVVTPYTFSNYEYDYLDDSFIMVASQSGSSTNSIAAINKIKELGYRTIGISADRNSDMARICDLSVDYGIGEEDNGFVTIGMTGLALFFMLFAANAAHELKSVDEAGYISLLKELNDTADHYQTALDHVRVFFEDFKYELLSMEKVFIMGCGPSYGAALEGALKIGEVNRIPSFCYESEEFLHGACLQVNSNYSLFFVDNDDETSERTWRMHQAAKVLTERSYLVTSKHGNDRRMIHVPGNDAYTSVLAKLAVFQYIAFKINDIKIHDEGNMQGEEFDRVLHIKTDIPR